MISKRFYWEILNNIKKLYWVLSSILIYQQCLLFCFSFSNTFINIKEQIIYCWNTCCFLPPLAHQKFFFNKPRTLLSSRYVHLIHCVKTLSKNLLGIELATDEIFLVLSPVNNDLFIHVFATGVSREITYVGNTELKNVTYISIKVTCTISFTDKET